jgi:hypothetical protein
VRRAGRTGHTGAPGPPPWCFRVVCDSSGDWPRWSRAFLMIRPRLTATGAVALGELKTTKTTRTRTVRLLAPLAADLREWRINRGRPADAELVFPGHGGGIWVDDAWRYWAASRLHPSRQSRWPRPINSPVRPAAFLRLAPARRGSERRRDRPAAGHSPTMTLSTYAHRFDEAAGAERTSAAEKIRRAKQLMRKERRTRIVPEDSSELSRKSGKEPANPGEPTRGFEPRTPSLRVKCSTS